VAEATEKQHAGFSIKWLIPIAVILAVVGLRPSVPLGDWLEQFDGWVAELGPTGIVVFVASYIVAAVLFLPASLLTIGAGVLFGLVRGTILVSIGSTLGAAAAFLVSRYFARDWVARKVAADTRFGAIDRAIGAEGWKIVCLLRLSPVVPYNLSNYLYGLTSVRFVPYVIASWLGMLPGTVMYVYLGAAGKAGLDGTAGASVRTWQQDALLGVGLIATIVFTVMITRIARNALKSTELEASE